jgi:arginine exporter protein ArgO
VRTPAQVFAVFVAMTLLNPVTLVYFAALTAALPGLLGAGASAWWFLPGVAVGSLSWQVLLAGAASLAGRRVGPRGRLAVSAVGYGIVVLLGVVAVVGGATALLT